MSLLSGDPTQPVPGVVVEHRLPDAGTGNNWHGRDSASGEPVVVRMLRLPVDDKSRARALLEARDLAEVKHEHLVPLRACVSTVQGIALIRDPVPGGISLGRLLERRPVLSPGEIVTLGVPMFQALAAMHAAGRAHGRMRPADILIATDGRPVLVGAGVPGVLGSAGNPADDVGELARILLGALGPPEPSPPGPGGASGPDEPPGPGGASGPDEPPGPGGASGPDEPPGPGGASGPDEVPGPRGASGPDEVPGPRGVPPTAVVAAALAPAVSDDAGLRPQAAFMAGALGRCGPPAALRLLRAEPAEPGPDATAGPGAAHARAGGGGAGMGAGDRSAAPSPWSAPSGSPFALLPRPARSRPHGPDAGGRETARWRRLPRTPLLTVVAVVAVAALGAVIGWAAAGGGPPGGSVPAGATGPADPLGQAGPAGQPEAGDQATTPDSPPDSPDPLAAGPGRDTAAWRGVVAHLDTVRAQAFSLGTREQLSDVDAPDGPALVHDLAAFDAMRARSAFARDLAPRIERVEVLSVGTTSAVVRVADTLPPYAFVDAGGRVLHRVTGHGMSLYDVTLVHTAGGWRVSSVRAAHDPPG